MNDSSRMTERTASSNIGHWLAVIRDYAQRLRTSRTAPHRRSLRPGRARHRRSRGIGKAIALALGRCKAKVACVARNADKLAETVSAITGAGGQAEAFTCDVTNSEAVSQLVESIAEKWGRLDILVNNAGITRDTLIPRMSDEQWDEVHQHQSPRHVPVHPRRHAAHDAARYGRIINISSVSGLIGNPGQANYSASKAAIIGFTRTVAKELAGRKITVNAIARASSKAR